VKKSLQKIPTSDLHLATYLVLNGIEPELSLQGGRIVFLFESNENFYRLTDAFNGNTAVKVLDFCQTLRRLKGKMLAEKDRNLRGNYQIGNSNHPA
jgi:hypothetical protein